VNQIKFTIEAGQQLTTLVETSKLVLTTRAAAGTQVPDGYPGNKLHR